MFQGSFLSVQPETHLHFLSRFLETSMFSSFVDGKVIARWVDRDPVQHLFDSRLERERLYDTEEEDSRNGRYRKCTSLFESGTFHLLCEIVFRRSIRTCQCCKMTHKTNTCMQKKIQNVLQVFLLYLKLTVVHICE